VSCSCMRTERQRRERFGRMVAIVPGRRPALALPAAGLEMEARVVFGPSTPLFEPLPTVEGGFACLSCRRLRQGRIRHPGEGPRARPAADADHH
jgi:hypothetical protein